MKPLTSLFILCFTAIAQNVVGGPDTMPTIQMVNGRPMVQNGSSTVIAYAVRRNTTGFSPVFWRIDMLKPGETRDFGMSMMYHPWKHTPTGEKVTEGTVISYEIVAAKYADGSVEGELAQRLNYEHRRAFGPGRFKSTSHSTKRPGLDANPYPGISGTPIFAFSGYQYFTEAVSVGESATIDGSAKCFDGPWVTYGYPIGGGGSFYNDGTCNFGDMIVTASSTQVQGSDGNNFETRQEVKVTATIGAVSSALLQQVEGCDFGGNLAPLAPGYGAVGDPWILVDHPGQCVAIEPPIIPN